MCSWDKILELGSACKITNAGECHTVVLKGKYQKKNVSDNPSMDSFTKIYIDTEKLWPKIREWDLFELTLQNDAKKP